MITLRNITLRRGVKVVLDDASATLGFLTIVASLTAIGVAATLVLRKN